MTALGKLHCGDGYPEERQLWAVTEVRADCGRSRCLHGHRVGRWKVDFPRQIFQISILVDFQVTLRFVKDPSELARTSAVVPAS